MQLETQKLIKTWVHFFRSPVQSFMINGITINLSHFFWILNICIEKPLGNYLIKSEVWKCLLNPSWNENAPITFNPTIRLQFNELKKKTSIKKEQTFLEKSVISIKNHLILELLETFWDAFGQIWFMPGRSVLWWTGTRGLSCSE